MRNYEELLNKSMRLGDFLKLIKTESIKVPRISVIEDGIRRQMISVDITKNSHTNIYIKYTNSVETYKYLYLNYEQDKMYITIYKIEYWNRAK